MVGSDPVLSVSQFVAVFNQSVQHTYPHIGIEGELANFRISRNRWVYLDLKDDVATVKFFGAVEQLPGPLEDGMMLEVFGAPNLHVQYGFTINISSLRIVGKGSIKKAQNLLAQKLEREGLFEIARKRTLPFAPSRIGIITAEKSAAFSDFNKIINSRWSNFTLILADAKVQGNEAPQGIVSAIHTFNELSEPIDVLVIIRGGGSPEDLAAFSNEHVVRAVAASRTPTIVAIGHESDLSLAELAADVRASTPSNAAELVVPSKHHELALISSTRKALKSSISLRVMNERQILGDYSKSFRNLVSEIFIKERKNVDYLLEITNLLDPKQPLKRGYAIVRDANDSVVKDISQVKPKDKINITLSNGVIKGRVE